MGDVDVVHLDFAKTFDSVNQRFLLAKLESFGLCERFVRWIRSYRTGRTYNVYTPLPSYFKDLLNWPKTNNRATSILVVC